MDFIRPPKNNRIIFNRINAGTKAEDYKDIEIPKTGGIFITYPDRPQKFAGFPHSDTVDALDSIKTFASEMILSVMRLATRNKLKTIIAILFFRKQIFIVADSMARAAFRHIRYHRLYAHRYCRAVREIGIGLSNLGVKEIYVDLAAVFLEFDSAYRFRVQDVLGEFNRASFKKNPFGELSRIAGIAYAREGPKKLKKYWKIIGWVIKFVRFHPRWRKKIILFFDGLNIDEVRMTEDDRWFAIRQYREAPFEEYNYTHDLSVFRGQ